MNKQDEKTVMSANDMRLILAELNRVAKNQEEKEDMLAMCLFDSLKRVHPNNPMGAMHTLINFASHLMVTYVEPTLIKRDKENSGHAE